MCRSICSRTEKVATFETLNETRNIRPAVSAAHLPLPATGYGYQRAKRPPIGKRTQNQQSDVIIIIITIPDVQAGPQR